MNEKIVYFYPTKTNSSEPLLHQTIKDGTIESFPITLTAKFSFSGTPANYRFELKLDGKTFISKNEVMFRFTGNESELGNFGSISSDFYLKNVSINTIANFEFILFNEHGDFLTSSQTALYFIPKDETANVEMIRGNNG